MQLIRKISSATLGWRKPEIQGAVLADKARAIPLYRVAGIATGIRTGKSKFDDRDEEQTWIALLGRFRAWSSHTDADNPYDSGVCFMPQYVVDAVAGQLAIETQGVKFAYDILAKYAEKSATSYEFLASALLEPAQDDPLENMLQSLPAATPTPKAIAAPKEKK